VLAIAADAGRPLRRTRYGRVLLLVALVVVVGRGVGLAAPLENPVALPTVPPPHVRFPAGFDAQGCALIAHGAADSQRVCPAVRTPTSSPSDDADWARYLGYEGPPAVRRSDGVGAMVLPTTLIVASHGWWRATGLVRNDAPEPVHEVRVTGIFAAADDRPLGTATTVVPVHDLRPGEPAPFELQALLPAEAVRRVRWRVTTAGANATSSSRMAEIEVGRIAPCPVAESAGLQAIAARRMIADAPIGWGILRNWGSTGIARPSVVAMWLDEKGRAVRMVDARIRPATPGARIATGELLPGATIQFDLIERETGVPRPRGWRLALWQTTS
jgi:hypothetical protein